MSQTSPTPEQCLGLSEQSLGEWDGAVLLHADVLEPLEQLRQVLSEHGCELCVASGYRRFEHQLAIFNAKVNGERPILDRDGSVLDPQTLSDRDCVFAILRWSALPGASRHHWGTDMDVFDAAALPDGYRLQLTPDEYAPGGVMEKLGGLMDEWLDGDGSEFFRPYRLDRGGVAPEPWHLSYAPLARAYAWALTPERLYRALQSADLALKTTVLAHFDEIFERFVTVPGELAYV